jgi:hypothetical protein
MATPNLLIANTVIGKTTSVAVLNTATTLVQNSNSSNALYKVSTIIVSNIDTSNTANVTMVFFRSTTGVTRNIIKNVSIPVKASFTPFDKSTIIYLEEGDSILISSTSNNQVEAICSYEEVI